MSAVSLHLEANVTIYLGHGVNQICGKCRKKSHDICGRGNVVADTDAADGPHGLGMQCHCTGVMPTGRACSDRPGFAKFARVTEMLVVPYENCGVVPRMSGA